MPFTTSRYEASIPMLIDNTVTTNFLIKNDIVFHLLASGGPFTGTLDAARVPVKCDDFSTFTPKYDVLSMFIVRLRQGECFR